MKRFCILLIAALVAAGFTHSRPEDNIQHYIFKRLETLRLQKKQQIASLFAGVEKKAKSIQHDKTLLTFFHTMNRDKHLLDPAAAIAPELRDVIDKYQRAIDDYYINNYLDFYDMLFIDTDGFVFYTLRKEPDYRSRLFDGKLANTKLAHCLRTPDEDFFVDFQYYEPAEEPAAFFLTRVYEGGVLKGWIVAQYALNMLNALLVEYQELGKTGEVYLVNQDLLMLTNSRFTSEGTCLKKRIDTEAVHDAFTNGAGNKRITGYRGVKVFTSYETFDLWGSRWAIVASIEESEMITLHFQTNQDHYRERLHRYLNDHPHVDGRCSTLSGKTVRVDIDEYQRAVAGQILKTSGVSTCTAVAVCLPGRFGYLAHISPRDKIYGAGNLTHLLKDMLLKMQYCDIHLNEMPALQFVVVANHLHSIGNIMHRLMSNGIVLSQIKFIYNPMARYGNVSVDCARNAVRIDWKPRDPLRQETCLDASQAEDLGTVAQKLFHYH